MRLTNDTIIGIINEVKQNIHVQDKLQIDETYVRLGSEVSLPKTYPYLKNCEKVRLGDDCTVIPDASGYLLMASEGMITSFLDNSPWFAGYSAVMVNISDIVSMGGYPIAVTDTIWGADQSDIDTVWAGMMAASKAYDVPIVGGHTCLGSDHRGLSVSILGRAEHLLTSFDAKPKQTLLCAIDLKGAYYENYPFWNASTETHAVELQKKMLVPKRIADQKLCDVAKDISMGGLLGTIAMLSKTSEVGFDINFEDLIPAPDEDWVRWLTSFPSYGFVLATDESKVSSIIDIFAEVGVTCHKIGSALDQNEIRINLPDGNTHKFN